MTQAVIRRPLMGIALVLVTALIAAAAGGAQEIGELRIDSITVTDVAFEAPVERRDAEGEPQVYDAAFRIRIGGRFPADRAVAVELFIGNYAVPEYGGNAEELYFTVYDQDLLASFEGEMLRYRVVGGELRDLGVQFSRDGIVPKSQVSGKN